MGGYYSTPESHKGPNGRYYGWKKDKPDERDHTHRLTLRQIQAVDEKRVDLREGCPAVYDQGQLGSCTANAIGGAFEFDLLRQGLKDFTPSRLFVYYNERVMEGNPSEDTGAEIRDGIKSINKLGVCSETSWPYNVERFTEKPPRDCYLAAKGNLALKYARISQQVDHLKAVLFHERVPIPFGFAVHQSFETAEVAEDGVYKGPGSPEEDPILGGHAVALVGYDDEKEMFIVRNSWGPEWGEKGYFYLPYSFVSNPEECSDFWVVKYVEENEETGTVSPPEDVPDAEVVAGAE